MALFGRPTVEDDRKAQEWAEWFAQRNPLAIAALVLGVFSLVEFGALIVPGIAGVILGFVALAQLQRRSSLNGGESGARTKGHALAWSGIALSVASLAIAAALYLGIFG